MPGPLLKVLKKGTTQIGRLAHEMGADWVIHNDADEFWWPMTGSNLKEALAAVPERFGIVLAPRTEFLPRPDGAGSFAERLTDPRGTLPAAAEDGPPHPPADQAVDDPSDRRLGEARLLTA